MGKAKRGKTVGINVVALKNQRRIGDKRGGG